MAASYKRIDLKLGVAAVLTLSWFPDLTIWERSAFTDIMQSQKRNCVQISVKAELQALYDTGKYAKLIIWTFSFL